MRIASSAASAIAGIALTLLAVAEAKAQTDTTRRAASDMRIAVRKGDNIDVTRRASEGEVGLAPMTRIDSLEALANSYRTRIDSLERADASITNRLDGTDRAIASLRDSLNTVRAEIATARSEMAAVRTELTATTARTERLGDSLQRLDRKFALFRNRSMFGTSGFYVGLGLGPSYTTGALSDLGYAEGMQVIVPLGWHKPGNTFGLRSELAWQNYDGRFVNRVGNVDPNIYSATVMGTAHFPFTSAKTHTIYLMGGVGVYHFRDFQTTSALGQAFGDTESSTKLGFTAGAGAQFHILGATYLFTQLAYANVSADEVVAPASGKNLGWIPLVLGVTIR
jgi:opacity protein-like surface antigen